MNFVRRSGVVLTLAAIMTASLTACGGDHESAAPGGSSKNPQAGLEKFYHQKLSWGGCDGYGVAKNERPEGMECTHVDVPVDYDKPFGIVAHIAISRVKASKQKVGSILFNPGGPGAPGLSMAGQGEGTRVAESFDRVGFDPRGIGASTPSVRCLNAKETDAQRQQPDWDNSPAGIVRQTQQHKDFAAKCTERTGNEFLAHVGTSDVVRDMDVIRAALGDDKLTYLGYSYGTRIGWAYAEAFPGHVRALVLDGAVAPDQDLMAESLGQSVGFQRVFDAYAADCAKNVPDCPLGNDPSQAAVAFRALMVPLQEHPAATKDNRGLSYGDAMTGVQQALYTPELWRPLTVGLREVQSGHGDKLLQLADIYDGRDVSGQYNNETAAFISIRCVDDPPMKDQAAVDQLDKKTREAAPFLDDGKGTGHAPLDQCSYWPVKQTSSPHKLDSAALAAKGLPKVVVVSTTKDPATPYQQGVDLAKQLGASLVTYDGAQHTVTFGNSPGGQCVDQAVVSYLVDLKQPQAGLTCAPPTS